ncbi:hypothetical protein [Thalassotalea atypica]|nr:hypothetical protein [Thalassotalea atypica]
MSGHENFSEKTSKRHLFIATAAMLAFPLLPMLMGWYSIMA